MMLFKVLLLVSVTLAFPIRWFTWENPLQQIASIVEGTVSESSKTKDAKSGSKKPDDLDNEAVDVNNHIPGEIEAASIARTLVFRESLANINTFKTELKDDIKITFPVSSVEYYVDCDNDGDIYWLVVDIGSTYQNILQGSEYSFTIRVGDHHINEVVNLEYPGGIVDSPAGSPRINMHGTLHDVEDVDGKYSKLEKCFLKRHPDAKWWIPKKSKSHSSHWMKLDVDEIYMIGGFGDRAYIGSIDTGIYHSVTSLDDH